MEILIALVVVVVLGALIYFNRSSRDLDVNKDGKIDLQDAAQAVDNTVQGVKDEVKKAAVKAKTAARAAVKKPAVKKTTAKPRTKK